MFAYGLVAAAIAALAATIAGDRQSKAYPWLKPLPLLIMLYTLQSGIEGPVPWLLSGYFLFCWLGDVALLAKRGFLLGLLAFLVGHLLLIALLWQPVTLSTMTMLLLTLPALIIGGSIARWLRPGSNLLLAGVTIYGASLVMLLMLAGLLCWQRGGLWCWTLLLVALFVFSDLLLAINRFRRPLAGAQRWILSTYFSSQWGWTWFWPTALAVTPTLSFG